MNTHFNRRDFLKAGAAAGAGVALSALPSLAKTLGYPTCKADALVVIYLPGGMAQCDLWDLKKHTPYEKGMKGSELLGTCRAITTKADGIQIGEGLENLAGVMDKACILRSLTNSADFGAVHLKAQHYLMTGYPFSEDFKAPSIGAVVARTLGRRDPNVPPYIYIGRDVDTGDSERSFINEYISSGFYGAKYGPFMIPDPAGGGETLSALSAMSPGEWRDSSRATDYMRSINDARTMMDSPVKKAFDYRNEEPAEVLAAYTAVDKRNRLGNGLLLARRLLEHGARFIQVEMPYGPFQGFDMHEYGQSRMVEMKQQIDRPLAQFINDLDQRGMLKRTLVVVMTEFGRTIASDLVIADESMYGFHGHFSGANSMLMFGGGFKGGFAYGKTADKHPMIPVENPVELPDVHATIYKALGIPADTSYATGSRRVSVTNGGKAIEAMLA